MKLFVDLLPIIAFFIVFKVLGGPQAIYSATATAIGVAGLVVGVNWWRYRKFDKQQLIMLGILVVLGGLTLALHDEQFIKWKPTVVSWIMGITFLGSRWIGGKTLAERMFGASIAAPALIWHRLNLAWTVFFISLGALNLYIAFHWTTEAWVNFKVFGTFGLSMAFAIAQALYLMRFAVEPQT
ncbi:MAG: septation protein A [Gammaproteobacteria bacterium]|nr:septation protein A [Gammaproteobacteria bacterium]